MYKHTPMHVTSFFSSKLNGRQQLRSQLTIMGGTYVRAAEGFNFSLVGLIHMETIQYKYILDGNLRPQKQWFSFSTKVAHDPRVQKFLKCFCTARETRCVRTIVYHLTVRCDESFVVIAFQLRVWRPAPATPTSLALCRQPENIIVGLLQGPARTDSTVQQSILGDKQ